MKPRRTWGAWRTWVGVAVLVAAATVVYWPSLRGGFIWDDEVLLANNPLLRTTAGLYRIWLTTDAVDFWPVTNTSFWLEWRVWGLNPTGYHVTNLILHAGNALIFWAILRRLAIPGSGLAALLFVVHPVNVESVAWIAQRKNTLSLAFFLLAILLFLIDQHRPAASAASGRHARQPASKRSRLASRPQADTPGRAGVSRWYWLSLTAFVFAMLAKGSVATLPLVLLLLAWWQRAKLTRTDFLRTLPFFAVSMGLTLVNLWFQSRRLMGPIRDVSAVQRVLGAGAVVWFYLGKALLPIHLSFIYPQWDVDAGDVRWWVPVAAAVATTVVLIRHRRRPLVRALLFAWACFCTALLPVLGLTDVYFMRYSLVADHYEYIALLAVVGGVSAALSYATQIGTPGAVVVRATSMAMLLLLGTATWQQSRQYADAGTLYRATLEANPACWLCETNQAVPLIAGGTPDDLAQALRHLQASIAINPRDPETRDALGVALQASGRFGEAAAEHERALELNPYFAQARANLAAAYHSLGIRLSKENRFGDAISAFTRALQAVPAREATHRELGYALLQVGRTQEALAQLTEAARLNPASAATHDTLGAVWRALNRSTEALAEYGEAVRLAPDDGDWRNDFGSALLDAGRLEEAAVQFRAALRGNPRDALAHRNLGVTLAAMGRLDEGVAELRQAVGLQPDVADARDQLDDLVRRAHRR